MVVLTTSCNWKADGVRFVVELGGPVRGHMASVSNFR